MDASLTILCYIRQGNQVLMLHRIRKEQDKSRGKWIGIGGTFEPGESPEECVLREVREETGLTLTSWQFRGLVTLVSDTWRDNHIHLFTADAFTGRLDPDCCEGELRWFSWDKMQTLPTWEGDRIFLDLLEQDRPFFSLKLRYQGGRLAEAALDGSPLPLKQAPENR